LFEGEYRTIRRYTKAFKVKPALRKTAKALPLVTLSKALTDKALKNAQASIEQKITTFEQLREAMRIACTDSELGLNDEGDDDIENIERRIKAFVIAKSCRHWRQKILVIER
jgi:hypothetical protein